MTFIPPGYLRPHRIASGGVEYRRIPACRCIGIARQFNSVYSVGQRGPVGGVCMVCNGAILRDDEKAAS